jgi:SP family facilitated glucose transporter-like MFS transporter 12
MTDGCGHSIHSTYSKMSNLASNEKIPPFVIKAAITASIGGILFGYDMGVTSMALPQLINTFNLTERQQEMLVSFLYIGCCIGATAGGYLCDRHGRKKMILITDCVFILGAIVLYSASTFDIVLLGRILIGFAVAVSGIADVAYLHEISPKQFRGAIVSCNEACIALGFMLSYLTGYGISVNAPNDGWRYMFGIGAVIAMFQFVGMMFMPESPIWLRDNNKMERAQKAFFQMGVGTRTISEDAHSKKENGNGHCGGSKSNLFGNEGDDELNSPKSYSSLNVEPPVSSEDVPVPERLTVTTMRKYFRQIIIAFFLSVMQNFCGHPNVLNFAPEIFAQIGFDSYNGRLVITTFVGVVSVFIFYLIGVISIFVFCHEF